VSVGVRALPMRGRSHLTSVSAPAVGVQGEIRVVKSTEQLMKELEIAQIQLAGMKTRVDDLERVIRVLNIGANYSADKQQDKRVRTAGTDLAVAALDKLHEVLE